MLQNYFKLAYRHLLTNKLTSAINVFGLSIAIASCITVFLFLRNYYTLDHFHINAENIYIAEYVVEKNGTEQIWGNSPLPLGPALADNFPQVERAVRVEMEGVKLYAGGRSFEELFYFADNNFFDLFTFPLTAGSPAALNEPGGVIISHDLAEKAFPDEDAMDKAITVSFGLQGKKVFIIKGIAEPFPDNTGFSFDLLAGFGALASFSPRATDDWAAMTRGTFVQLKPGVEIAELEKSMSPYVALHNAANSERPIKAFRLDNLKNPAPMAREVIRRPAESPHPYAAMMFAAMALLMFVLSCINYINISLGQSANRLKEIGVRKVVGGKKRQLVGQFMSENLLLCCIAMVIGLALTQMVLIPFFNSIMTYKISLSLSGNIGIWAFLLGLLAVTGIASGAYPAMYISSFQTVSIFRGKSSFSNKSKLTRVFLCLQFVLAFGTVIGGILLISMADVWKQQSWGYQPDRTLVVRLDEAGQFDLLKNEALRHASVRQVGSATNHIGESVWRSTIFIEDQEMDAARFEVGAGYAEAMGLHLADGRFFDPLRKTEDSQSVVVNREFLEKNGWEAITNQQIRFKGTTYNIVGVVDDFKIIPTGVIKPAVFFLAADSALAYVAIRYEAGTGEQVESYLQSAWDKLAPGTPFNAFHQELVFDNFYQEFNSIARLFNAIAALALLIACFGLFGLASQNYASRLKESSIRKVLGATTHQIILQANRNFITLLLIASVVATGICFGGFQMMTRLARDFMGETHLGISPYLLANGLVFIMAGISMAWQSFRLANVMPAETLRNE